MTDEELNVEICKWRGWKNIPAIIHKPDFLPSHITGLSALGNIHEAEKELSDKQQSEYVRQLEFLIHPDGCSQWLTITLWPMVSATARQRAIALLRVVKPELFA